MQQDIKAVYQIDNKSLYDIRTLSIIKIKQFSIIEILNNFKHKGIEKLEEKIKKLAIIIIYRGRQDIQEILKDIYLNISDPIKSIQRFQEFQRILQLYSEDDLNNALKTITQEQIEQILKFYIEGNEITKKFNAEILIQQIEKYFAQNNIKRKDQNQEVRELLDYAFDVYESRITDQQTQQKEWDLVRKQYEDQQYKQSKDAEAQSIKPINEDYQEVVCEEQPGQSIIQEQLIDFNLGQDIDINEKDQNMELEEINKQIQKQDIKNIINTFEEKQQVQKPNSGNSKSFFELIQQSNNSKKQPQQQEIQQTKSKKSQQKKKPTELAAMNTDVYKQIQSQIIQLKGAVKSQKEQILDEQKQTLISVQGDEIQLWENIQEQIKGESWYEEINKQVESEQNSFIPILKRIAPLTVSRWEKQQQIQRENIKLQREKDQQEKQQIEIEQQKQQEKQLEKQQLKQYQEQLIQQEKSAKNSAPQIEFNPIREEHSLFQSRLDYHRQLFRQKEQQEIKKQQNIIEIESSDDGMKYKDKKQQDNNQKQFEIIDDEPQKPSEQNISKLQQDQKKDLLECKPQQNVQQLQQMSNKDPQECKPQQQQIQENAVIEKQSDNIPNKYRRHENNCEYRAEDIIYTPQQQQECQVQNNQIDYDMEIPFQYNQGQGLIFDESVDSLDIPNMETNNLDLSQDVEILEDYTKKNNLKNQLDFYNNGLQENKIFHIRPELKPLNNDQKAATLLSLLKITKFNFTIRQVQQDKQQLLRDKAFHSYIRIIYNIITNYLQERVKIQIKQIIHNASKFYGEITIQMPNGKKDQQQYEAENQFVVHTFLRLIGLDFIVKNVYGNKQDMTFQDIIKYLSAKISSKTYQEYKELTSPDVPIQQDPQPRVRNWEMIFYEEEKERDNEFIDKVQSRIQPRKQTPQDANCQQALKNIQQQEYYRQTQKIQEQSINVQPQKNQKDQNKAKQSSQKRQQKQEKNQKKMNQKKNKEISSEEEGEVKVDILEKVKQQQDTFEKNLMSKILQGIQVGIQEGIQQVQKSVDTKLQQMEEKQQTSQKQLTQQGEQKDQKKNNSSNKSEDNNKSQNKNQNNNVGQNKNYINANQKVNQNVNQNQNLNQNQNQHQNTIQNNNNQNQPTLICNRKKNKLNPVQQQYQGYPTFNQIIPDLQCNPTNPQSYGGYNQPPVQYMPPYQQYHPQIQHQIPINNHNPYGYQYPMQNQYYPPSNQYNNQHMQQRKPNKRNWK